MKQDAQMHLKDLESQLEDGQRCLAKSKEDAAAAQRQVSAIERRMEMMRRQIESAQAAAAVAIAGGITVSDHAIVRYLERAHGLDMDRVREEMLDQKTQASIAFLNGAKGKINVNGLTYIVENNTIITVVPSP